MASHEQVAHNWANRTGRCQTGHNLHYRGDTIYSYGDHFPVARHIENSKGEHAVLFTTDSYSISTTNHKNIVWRACSHLTRFAVPHVGRNGYDRDNYRDYERRAYQLVIQSTRRRHANRAAADMNEARALIREGNEYARFLGKKWNPLVLPSALECREAEAARLARIEQERQRMLREADKVRKATEAEIAREYAKKLPAWRAGGRVYMPYVSGSFPVALRLTTDGQHIETSRQADFPVADAKAAWPKLRRAFETLSRSAEGTEFDTRQCREFIRLGNFRVDKLDTRGVTAGCHFVEWSEIFAMAETLGLIEAVPA